MMNKGVLASVLTSLMATSGGMDFPLIKEVPVPKLPRMPLTEEELETLASFEESREGRKAKKKYVKELEAKYAGRTNE